MEREEIQREAKNPEYVSEKDNKDKKTIRFGATTMIEIGVEAKEMENVAKEPGSKEEYVNQGLDEGFYASKKAAKIHAAREFNQAIGCGSRTGLLREEKKKQHQLVSDVIRKDPKFLPDLKLKTGLSGNNYLATTIAYNQLCGDLGEGWASNRIAPQTGQEYKILENMAWATGAGKQIFPLTLERVATIKEGHSKNQTTTTKTNQEYLRSKNNTGK